LVLKDQKEAQSFLETLKSPVISGQSLKVEYSERSGTNMCLYCVYKVIRFLHVAIWFYTAPLLAVGLQFWLIDNQLEGENSKVESEMREELLKEFIDTE